MNTQQLQKDFPEVYEEFFSKYDLVVSSPIVNHYTGLGIYRNVSTYAGIGYKIPLRNYVGIKFNNSTSESISYTFKKNAHTPFVTAVNIEKDYPLQSRVLRENGLVGDIGLLSEYSRTDYPSIMANLILLELCSSGKIDIEQLNNLDIQKDYYTLLQLFSTHSYVSLFTPLFVWDFATVVLHSNSPIVFSKGKDGVFNYEVNSNRLPTNLDLNHFIINFNLNPTLRPNLNYLESLQNSLYSFAKERNLPSLPSSLLDAFGTISQYATLDLTRELEKLYLPDGEEYSFFKKLESYNIIRSGSQGTHQQNSDQVYKIRKYLVEHVGIETPFSLFAMGQRTHFFTPKRTEFVSSHLDEYNKLNDTQYTLDYSSLEDGMEFQGTKIEQRTSKGLFSKFYRKFICYEVFEDKSVVGNTCIEKGIPQTGLVLDSYTSKIYINGHSVNSSEIFSQRTTIEILGVLIKNLGKEITNKDLPSSSYAKNKNTLVGKIILPLQKVLDESGLGKIEISVTGSLYSYSLCLKYSSFPIYYNVSTR